jgi:polyisoprenoid-binding protein YceI
MKKQIIAAILAFGMVGSAMANNLVLVAPSSKVQFEFKQMGVPVEGNFRKFNAQLRFDPKNLLQSKVVFEVDLSSIDAGSPEANAEVAGKDWFDFKTTTVAKFQSTGVKPLPDGTFEVQGPLTIRGKTVNMVIPFKVESNQGKTRFLGTFPIQRLSFGIGSGMWGDPSVVADRVDVRFDLLAVSAIKK